MIFDLSGGGSSEEEALWMPELSAEMHEELFGLAYMVREMEPWKEFLDQDWYGVEDPETGEIQIVSILGMEDQVYAIQLYLPEEGIRFWNELILTERLNKNAVLFDLRMIECEFCSKDKLADEDLEWNELHPPKGKRKSKAGYVSFRSHRPEHYPWFIEEDEARMMANALRLLPVFCDYTEPVEEEEYYTMRRGEIPRIPIFGLKKGGDPRKTEDWKGRVDSFPVVEPKQVPEAPQDDVFHARMATLSVKSGTDWEIGSFFVPGPTKIGDRLVFPTLTVTAPHEVDALPMPSIGSPADNRMTLLRQSFATMADQMGYLPDRLVVASPLAEVAFRELAESSGMTVEPVEVLPNLAPAVEKLVQSFAGGGADQLSSLPGRGGGDPAELEPRPTYREPTCPARFVMRIDLVGAKPPIWRRISMPVDASFFDLHVAIQEAMGWQDSHLHKFEIRDGRDLVAVIEWDSDVGGLSLSGLGIEELSELETTLVEVVQRGFRKINYSYDFGDSWEHRIQIEDVIDPKVLNPLPEFLKGRGACPPENCGGIGAYHAILDGDPEFADCWDPAHVKEIQNAKFDPKAVEFTPARKSYERWVEGWKSF